MPRRVHSSIDKLPAEIREAITTMIVDGVWPKDYPSPANYSGKPRYEDIVTYCQLNGQLVSSSAVGRWAKQLLSLELLRTRAELVRPIMSDLTAEKATETHKAAAEMIAARVLELVCTDELNSRQAKEVAAAVRDCTNVSIKADKYISEQLTKKIKVAVSSTRKKLTKAGVNRRLIQEIIDEHLGVVKS